MEPAVKKVVAVIALLMVGAWGMGVDAMTRVSLVYNTNRFEQGSAFHNASNYVVKYLLECTPIVPDRNYSVESPGPLKVYGKATCSFKINEGECYTCLYDSLVWKNSVYPAAMGANVQYDVCTFRYEGYQF